MEAEGDKASRRTPRCLLLGSGEFQPWVGDIELEALKGPGGNGSVVVLATASAQEGDAVFERWNRMGLDHYAALGLRVRALPVRNRKDAEVEEHAQAARGASLLFFSGGNPQYLARTVEGTLLWTAIGEALDAGSVYAGCSAGAMVAGSAERSGPSRGRF